MPTIPPGLQIAYRRYHSIKTVHISYLSLKFGQWLMEQDKLMFHLTCHAKDLVGGLLYCGTTCDEKVI